MEVGNNLLIAWIRKYIFNIKSPSAYANGFDYEYDWIKSKRKKAKKK